MPRSSAPLPRLLLQGAGRITNATAGTFVITTNGGAITTAIAGGGVHYLDPALLALGRYRLLVSLMTNGTAPAITFTAGLYPVTATGGATGTVTVTTGTVVAGSTVAFTTPAVTSQNQGDSGEFTAPAAGYYTGAVVASGTATTNSDVYVNFRLMGR